MRAVLAALALIAAALCAASPASAQYAFGDARITHFRSLVEVRPDGVLDVTEIIAVIADGSAIRRGIIRSFPTEYDLGWGLSQTVRFDVVSVTRNGVSEPWSVESAPGGKDLRIGDPARLLQTGPHTYTIRYLTDRQIGFFDDHDELYWNVTGNGWEMRIEAAEAIVRLPPGATAGNLATFTGLQGATDSDAIIAVAADGTVEARTTVVLPPKHGFTIGVSFPKGFVAPPGFLEKAGRMMADNPGGLAALAGLAVMFAYYLYGRWRHTTGAVAGQVIPIFDPPDDISPVDARMLDRRAFDATGVSVALLNLAALGYIRIEQLKGDSGEIAIERLPEKDSASGLPDAERIILREAFRNGGTYAFSKKNERRSGMIYREIKKRIDKVHAPNIKTFNDRTGGCLLIVIATAIAVFVFTSGLANWLIVLAVVVAMIVLGMAIEGQHIQLTPAGQKKMDIVEGLRMYLGTAEEERWNALHPPDLTPARFERLFPYALALGVEQAWSEAFQQALRVSGADPAAYAPSFYSGSTFRLSNSSGFASSVGRAVAPAAVSSSGSAPGRSSYSSGSSFSSSGGGSSGGGGGGGGGRGW